MKEEFVRHETYINSLIKYGMTCTNRAQLYSAISIIQNVTNSHPKKTLTEEQKKYIELARLAKEYIPEDHVYDQTEYVKKRTFHLVEHDLLSLLVHVSKVAKVSENIRECIARILMTVAEDTKYRGLMVARGAHLPLLDIANNGRSEVMNIAAQSLAKIAVTSDPRLVFPGQQSVELVKPFIRLLDAQHELQIFESLLALTNLSAESEEVRKKILYEDGVSKIAYLQTDDCELIQRAATECLCNLLYEPEIFSMYVQETGTRFQDILLWLFLCGLFFLYKIL
ncbi:protein unc-45 homolog B-like [Zophobas morio]|uniref:protein unc-45 homolog B-like n=1 Tax=Zophobas morio TaxID=2755281 RepID=UPI0030839EDF